MKSFQFNLFTKNSKTSEILQKMVRYAVPLSVQNDAFAIIFR